MIRVTVLLLYLSGSAGAQELVSGPQVHFDAGLKLAAERDSLGAMAAFEAALRTNQVSAEAAYNLGTLALRTGDVGPARLYLERASRLDPLNASIEKNLRLAREAADAPDPRVFRAWLSAPLRLFPPLGWSLLAVVLSLVTIFVRLRKGISWRGFTAAAFASLLVLAIALALVWRESIPAGIVLQSVEMQGAPGSSSIALGRLKAGQDVRIGVREAAWVRVTGRGVTGWVPARAVALIRER